MSRYASTFTNPQGPGDARPTAMQIIRDEGLEGKLHDKVFFITGVSSGIGIETLRAFHATGAHVFGTVRDREKGRKVVEEIEANAVSTALKGRITLIEMHLDDLASVKKGAEEFLRQATRLDVLVCNAGIMAVPFALTKDNLESQFGINYMAHFALFQHLKPLLLSTASVSNPVRVLTLSSLSHRTNSVRANFDYNFRDTSSTSTIDNNYENKSNDNNDNNPSTNVQSATNNSQDPIPPGSTPPLLARPTGPYNPWHSYAQSKVSAIWFTSKLTRHYSHRHLYGLSLHPGVIWTNLQTHIPGFEAVLDRDDVAPFMLSAAQGAATTVMAGLSKELEGKGAVYLADCVVQGRQKREFWGEPMSFVDSGYAGWAFGDLEGEDRLWRDSVEIVGMGKEDL